MDILACQGLNFKSRPNHTIWGSLESSFALECVKCKKGIQEMKLGRHVVKIRKIAIERQNETQSKAHGLKKYGENVNKNILRNLWPKVDTLAFRG